MLQLAKRLFVEEEGQGMVEYGLILALVAVVVIVALTGIGTNIKTVFEDVRDHIVKPTPPAGG